MGHGRARWGLRKPGRKRIAALLAGFVVLGRLGAGLREMLRDADGALVPHGPFLVPRSLILSSIPPAPARPAFSLPQFIIRNSAFVIRPFWGSLAFAQGWDRKGLGFFKVDITGSETITTVAGTGTGGFAGDGMAATSAQLNGPTSVAIDGSGNLFIADHLNHRIRKVAAGTGTITTMAGTGIAAFGGDGGPATSAQLNEPGAVTLDAGGNSPEGGCGSYSMITVTASLKSPTTWPLSERPTTRDGYVSSRTRRRGAPSRPGRDPFAA